MQIEKIALIFPFLSLFHMCSPQQWNTFQSIYSWNDVCLQRDQQMLLQRKKISKKIFFFFVHLFSLYSLYALFSLYFVRFFYFIFDLKRSIIHKKSKIERMKDAIRNFFSSFLLLFSIFFCFFFNFVCRFCFCVYFFYCTKEYYFYSVWNTNIWNSFVNKLVTEIALYMLLKRFINGESLVSTNKKKTHLFILFFLSSSRLVSYQF